IAVIPGHTYQVQAWVLSSVAREMRLLYRWYDAADAQVGTDENTTAVEDSTTEWTLLSASLTAPPGAVSLKLYPHSVSGWNGDYRCWDAVVVHDGAWPSVDVLKRRPGTRAWDFLSPLLSVSGLRLFCDEERKWRLVTSPYDTEG